jgi:hypothetical protein
VQEIAANVARGMPATKVRRVALRGLTHTREAVREVRTLWLESLWDELSTGLRSLCSTRGVTAIILGFVGSRWNPGELRAGPRECSAAPANDSEDASGPSP